MQQKELLGHCSSGSSGGIISPLSDPAEGVAVGSDLGQVAASLVADKTTVAPGSGPVSDLEPLPRKNSVCLHVACSRQPYCFVSELKRVRESYLDGKLDQFKKKAIDKAIK